MASIIDLYFRAGRTKCLDRIIRLYNSPRCMKSKCVIILGIVFATATLSYFAYFSDKDRQLPLNDVTDSPKLRKESVKSSKLPDEQIQNSLIEESGESHVMALETIMEWINQQLVLTDEDRDVMIAYISQTKPDNMADGAWQERVNEILNFLRSQPGAVPGLSDLLLNMASKDPDPVMRMYALQHIALWIPSEPDEENKNLMIAYLEMLAVNTNDPLAGSAVLFLNDLDHSKNLPKPIDSAALIEEAAMNLVATRTASPDVRICALHTCAERGLTAASVESRTIAQDETLMVPLRKAAIYTLGEVGVPEDVEFLEALAASNGLLETSTTPAIKRIKTRQKE